MGTIPNRFATQVARRPDHEALYSTEGSLIYKELDHLSHQLSIQLSQLGVRPETIVPFCFEKSIWAVATMMGIMKASGVFLPLDPSRPIVRRQALIDEVNAQYMVVSPTTASECENMTRNTIELSPALISQLSELDALNEPAKSPGPKNAAYILFTSGSTGKPKGIITEHQAICTALEGQRIAFNINDNSRLFQFANYIFDACIPEIFAGLLAGATICVPTETERTQNTSAFITQPGITIGILTPTFIKTLSPEKLPSMKTLVLCGEAPTKDIVDSWISFVGLRNGYGPAEACVCSSYNMISSPDISATNIGRGFTHRCWVVDPDNHHQLMPIGCIGELFV